MDSKLEEGSITGAMEKESIRHNTFWNRIYNNQFLVLGAVGTIVLALGAGLGVGLGVGLSKNTRVPPPTTPPPVDDQTILPTTTTSSIWQPKVGTSWQIVLENPITVSDPVTPSVSVFEIDLFTNTKDTIKALHNQGTKVICYFSAGTYEDYRPDSKKFAKADLGKELDGWPGEYWLNTHSPAVRKLMVSRIQLAATKGCDGIDPDNLDGFETNTGFPLSTASALDYLSFLSKKASNLGLAIGLKNAGEIATNATSLVQYSIIESCVDSNKCSMYQPFITAGKPIFHIEYPKGAPGNVKPSILAKACPVLMGNNGFSEIIKSVSLDGWVEFCNGVIATTLTA